MGSRTDRLGFWLWFEACIEVLKGVRGLRFCPGSLGREEAWATADGVVLVVVLVLGACLNFGGLMRAIGRRWSMPFLLTRSGLGERKSWCRKNDVYLLIDRRSECSTSHTASCS